MATASLEKKVAYHHFIQIFYKTRKVYCYIVMKKFISIFMVLVLAASYMITSASATDITENSEAVLLPTDVNSLDELTDASLIDSKTIHFIVDENGELIDYFEGDFPTPYDNTADWGGNSNHYTATVYFYKSGSTYYVSMSASTMTGYWFVKHELKIRPKNNSDWFVHTYPHEDKPTSISDLMSFYYPDGEPTNVSVEVKGYFSLRGEAFAMTFTWPEATLDNPG